MTRNKLLLLIKESRIFLESFFDKELTLFSASLSFYTIFTIIPLLLIVLTLITSMPSFHEQYALIKNFIFSNLMPVNSKIIMKYIDGFLQNSVKMGVISFVSVIVASMLFFQNFEYIVNRIFHAPKRTLWEYITTYWTLVTLTPIALGVSFFISGKFATFVHGSFVPEWVNIMKIFSYLIVWGLFFLIYQIAANVKTDPKASLIASFIVSLIFTVAKSSFIYYVVYNKTYATMYGSFSIVIFLFLWIYISWIIFIYGMKLCYIIDRIYKKQRSLEEQQPPSQPRPQSQE
jgi:membrane protein